MSVRVSDGSGAFLDPGCWATFLSLPLVEPSEGVSCVQGPHVLRGEIVRNLRPCHGVCPVPQAHHRCLEACRHWVGELGVKAPPEELYFERDIERGDTLWTRARAMRSLPEMRGRGRRYFLPEQLARMEF
jgi:hypothetical protein